jgi:hypothetical protein
VPLWLRILFRVWLSLGSFPYLRAQDSQKARNVQILLLCPKGYPGTSDVCRNAPLFDSCRTVDLHGKCDYRRSNSMGIIYDCLSLKKKG